MYRCLPLASFTRRAAFALAATSALVVALPASAQLARNFPPNALRGDLIVNDPSSVSLNRRAAQLAPGARIRDPNNLIVPWSNVAGTKLYVNYTIDTGGMLQDVWILSDVEADRWPWPRTLQEAQTWSFDQGSQVWTKP